MIRAPEKCALLFYYMTRLNRFRIQLVKNFIGQSVLTNSRGIHEDY